MMLIDDWKRKYPKFWSVWFGASSVVLSGLEVVNALGYILPAMESRFAPGTFAVLSAVAALAGIIARAIKQEGLE